MNSVGVVVVTIIFIVCGPLIKTLTPFTCPIVSTSSSPLPSDSTQVAQDIHFGPEMSKFRGFLGVNELHGLKRALRDCRPPWTAYLVHFCSQPCSVVYLTVVTKEIGKVWKDLSLGQRQHVSGRQLRKEIWSRTKGMQSTEDVMVEPRRSTPCKSIIMASYTLQDYNTGRIKLDLSSNSKISSRSVVSPGLATSRHVAPILTSHRALSKGRRGLA
jgi:hypothetical protein